MNDSLEHECVMLNEEVEELKQKLRDRDEQIELLEAQVSKYSRRVEMLKDICKVERARNVRLQGLQDPLGAQLLSDLPVRTPDEE